MKNHQWILAGVTVVVICILSAGIFSYASRGNSAAALSMTGVAQTLATSSVPSGYLPYANRGFHFSLDYPNNLKVQEYQEQDGGFTVVFQDPTTNEGFEVYAIPYDEPQIDKARFKLDEPSGVVNDPTKVTIDGVQAIMFYGNNPEIGDTREVWFAHNQVLYEVTTYKALASWLTPILQTWNFLP
jgi:hypothetical protein